MYISWIIPAYNEEQRISKTLRAVSAYLRSKGLPGGYEIIVVDSTSRDRTAAIVATLGQEIPNVRLMTVENRGKGWAVKQGMLAATGDIRLFADADNSVSPEQADRFLPHLCTMPVSAPCADIVIGSIEVRGASVQEHAQQYRRLLGKLAKYVIRIVSGLWEIRDSQRGFKFFTRRAAETIFPRQTLIGWGFDFEVLLIGKRHEFSIRELPVVWINPPDSKVKLSAYATTLGELLRVRWNDVTGKYR
ncbi:MAG: dolichyl-phosphate beta-glucosyltransferase [Patescibacteria group bacterium]